ncbi:(d)CMP kinase [Agrococcus sp. SGAir0287]|nr:(d)CMP kinase [Agrococcus sp. SGAir0287]QCR19570.1 (d)CMP kinase [Agrococcus sp. SGAir0287]
MGGGLVTTVAIDGPAGSGKSSVARVAAEQLGFHLLDTGAAYRSLAWLVLERGLDPYVEADVLGVLDDFDYAVDTSGPVQRFSVGGVDVTDAIRTERISAAVSGVARVPAVRKAVNVRFRALIAEARPGIVVEGRDITTVVAPDADVRILLTADEDVRIRRRIGDVGDAAGVGERLSARDRSDNQVVDFMTPAPGVTLVDSTHLDFDETVAAVVELVRTQERA